MFAYTVRCEIDDHAVAEEWVLWMTGEHLADVIAAGAVSADLVILDGEPRAFEARYAFASRDAYDAYIRDHAPRLRAEGLALFPLERGLKYLRTCGEVLLPE